MDPAQVLRERERELLAGYEAGHPPRAFDAEDLECDDVVTAEHWVGVYTELVDFVHSVIEPTLRDRPAPACAQAPNEPSAIELQARVLELHLAYWTDRLDRLRTDPGSAAG